MTIAEDFIINKRVPHGPDDPCLRTGAQFRESLRDGRCVIFDGREVADVTAEPALKRGIDSFAWLFDAQFDPKYREITTSIEPETGERIATGWLLPYMKEDPGATTGWRSSAPTTPSACSAGRRTTGRSRLSRSWRSDI